MRQWLAAVLVAGLCGAPVLRVVCEVTCGATNIEQPSAKPSCHEPSAVPSPVNLNAPDECGDHTVLPALLSAQKAATGTVNVGSYFGEMTPDVISRGVQSVHFTTAHARGSTSPPIPPGTRILRV